MEFISSHLLNKETFGIKCSAPSKTSWVVRTQHYYEVSKASKLQESAYPVLCILLTYSKFRLKWATVWLNIGFKLPAVLKEEMLPFLFCGLIISKPHRSLEKRQSWKLTSLQDNNNNNNNNNSNNNLFSYGINSIICFTMQLYRCFNQ